MSDLTKLFFYLILLIIILFSTSYIEVNKREEVTQNNLTFNKKIDYNVMLNIIKKDNEILNMIVNGAKVSPLEKVTQNERNKIPAIYKNLPEELYKTKVEHNNVKLIVIFDRKKVYKKVNLMNLRI